MLNLLVVMVDCLRQDRFQGAEKTAITPNLDAFLARSISFETVHSVGSNTTSVMGSWFTGTYPFVHGLRSFRDRRFTAAVPTMASLLKNAGYRTAATVTEALAEAEDLLAGFDEIERRNKKVEAIHDGYGERARRKLVELNASAQPWFYFIHSCELHPDRQCDPRFKHRRFGRDFFDRSLSSVDHHLGPIFDAVDRDRTVVVAFGDHGDNLIWEPHGEFLSMIMNRLRGDGRVSALWRLRDWFYRTGLYGSWKGMLRHNALFHHDYHVYRFLTHSPLMMAVPGQQPRRVGIPMSSVDAMPTLLDYLGAPVPRALDGISFAAILRGESMAAPPRSLYQEVVTDFVLKGRDPAQLRIPLLRALVAEEWKFVNSAFDRKITPELYNLADDPHELRNLYPARQDSDLVARLAHELETIERSGSVGEVQLGAPVTIGATA